MVIAVVHMPLNFEGRKRRWEQLLKSIPVELSETVEIDACESFLKEKAVIYFEGTDESFIAIALAVHLREMGIPAEGMSKTKL